MPEIQMSTIESRLQRALDTVTTRAALGAALAIDVAGKREATVSGGFRDISRSAPFKPDLLYQIGSQTKMFVGAGILARILRIASRISHAITEKGPREGRQESLAPGLRPVPV